MSNENINLFTKAIFYRLIRILLLLSVALIVLGDIKTALSISAIDAVVATIYYYFFDRCWDKHMKPKVEKCYLRFKYRKLRSS